MWFLYPKSKNKQLISKYSTKVSSTQDHHQEDEKRRRLFAPQCISRDYYYPIISSHLLRSPVIGQRLRLNQIGHSGAFQKFASLKDVEGEKIANLHTIHGRPEGGKGDICPPGFCKYLTNIKFFHYCNCYNSPNTIFKAKQTFKYLGKVLDHWLFLKLSRVLNSFK